MTCTDDGDIWIQKPHAAPFIPSDTNQPTALQK